MLVHVSTYQGSILVPFFEPQPYNMCWFVWLLGSCATSCLLKCIGCNTPSSVRRGNHKLSLNVPFTLYMHSKVPTKGDLK